MNSKVHFYVYCFEILKVLKTFLFVSSKIYAQKQINEVY